MPGIQSNAVEPTKDDLRHLTPVQKALRLAPTYGLVILMFGLIILFSILLPNTFPTMLNLRAILSDKAIIALLSLAAMIPMVAGRIDLTPLAHQNGLFSMLPVTKEEVAQLREEHGIYMAASGRINIAGLTQGNLPKFIAALAAVAQ